MLWALLTISALGADVLLPVYTPRTTSDLGVAEQITDETLRALLAAGLDVADPEILAARAGDAADVCAESARCNGALWEAFPEGKVLVVGQAWAAVEGKRVEVRIYRPNEREAVETMILSVAEGADAAFAARLAGRVADWVATPLPKPVAAEPAVAPDDPYRVLDPYTDERLTDPPSIKTVYTPPSPEEEAAIVAANPPPRPAREGRTSLALYLGPVVGDLDRRYDVRDIFVDDGDEVRLDPDIYQYEAFRTGKGLSLGLTISHAPLPWIEATLGVGAQFGHAELSTGYEIQDEDGHVLELGHDPLQTGSAVHALIEPGLRGYPLPELPVKPYVLARMSTRLYGSIAAPTRGGVDLPDSAGGAGFGLGLGLGAVWDPGEHLSLLLEIPWTVWLTAGATRNGGAALDNVPPQAEGVGQSLEARAALAWRL